MTAPTGDAGPRLLRPERLALGCVAGLAVAVVATWLRFGWEGTIGLDTGTVPFLVSAFLAGSGLAVTGVCALRLQRRDASLDRAHLRWAIALQLVGIPALALTSLDLFSNVAYGQLQRVGRNPYLEGPAGLGPGPLLSLIAPRWANATSAYGPINSLVSRMSAAIGDTSGSLVWGGAAAFKLFMVACAIATLVVAFTLLRREGEAEGASRFALIAFSPVLAWEISAQAHNDGLLVLALMVFVWAALTDREGLAVVALTAGVLSKAPAAPLLVMYLAYLARRSWTRALVLAGVAACLAVVLLAPFWHGLVTLQGSGTAAVGDIERHAHSLADLLALVLRGFAPRAAAAAYWGCWATSIVLCGALVVRGARRAVTAQQVIHDGLVLVLAYLLTTPWFQPWYAAWLLPLAVAERSAAVRRVVALYAVVTVVQWALPLDPVSTVAANAWIAVLWWRAAREPAQRSSQDAWRRTGTAPVI